MSLDTAREALLDDARREAEAILARADAAAAARLQAARREAEELRARARAQGEAEGRVGAAQTLAGERFAARMRVLGARRASYDALLEQARRAALALREDPDYPQLLERLAAAARKDLGPGTELTVDPPGQGGVLGRAGSRAVDYTLVALAERCVRDLGPRVAELWA
jgi:vacuolar-type H+-ATPase subunit E/Vma4